jgi:hypothetical protein
MIALALWAALGGAAPSRAEPATSSLDRGWLASPLGTPQKARRVDVTRVVQGGPGLVALGAAGATPTGQAMLWTSADGQSWQPVSLSANVFPRRIHVFNLAAGPHGMVLLGQNQGPPEPPIPVLWYSTDGTQWRRSTYTGIEFPVFLAGVTRGGPGFVAVGSEQVLRPDGEATNQQRGVVLASADGRSWRRIQDRHGIFKHVQLTDVTAGGRGLVAVGTYLGAYVPGSPSSQQGYGVIYTSRDGVRWPRVPAHLVAPGGGPTRAGRIAAGVAGVVALGRSGEPTAGPAGLTLLPSVCARPNRRRLPAIGGIVAMRPR